MQCYSYCKRLGNLSEHTVGKLMCILMSGKIYVEEAILNMTRGITALNSTPIF